MASRRSKSQFSRELRELQKKYAVQVQVTREALLIIKKLKKQKTRLRSIIKNLKKTIKCQKKRNPQV